MIYPDTLNLWHDQLRVGLLWCNPGGAIGLRYDPDWIARGGSSLNSICIGPLPSKDATVTLPTHARARDMLGVKSEGNRQLFEQVFQRQCAATLQECNSEIYADGSCQGYRASG